MLLHVEAAAVFYCSYGSEQGQQQVRMHMSSTIVLQRCSSTLAITTPAPP
jgi:hypothetical protein